MTGFNQSSVLVVDSLKCTVPRIVGSSTVLDLLTQMGGYDSLPTHFEVFKSELVVCGIHHCKLWISILPSPSPRNIVNN